MFFFFWAAGSTTGLSSLCPFCCFLKPTCGQLYQYWLLDPMYIHTWRDFPIPFKDIHFLDAYWNSNLVVFGNSDTPQVKTPRNMKTFNGIFLKGNLCHVRYSSSFTALFSAFYRGDPSIQQPLIALAISLRRKIRAGKSQTPWTFGETNFSDRVLGRDCDWGDRASTEFALWPPGDFRDFLWQNGYGFTSLQETNI